MTIQELVKELKKQLDTFEREKEELEDERKVLDIINEKLKKKSIELSELKKELTTVMERQEEQKEYIKDANRDLERREERLKRKQGST